MQLGQFRSGWIALSALILSACVAVGEEQPLGSAELLSFASRRARQGGDAPSCRRSDGYAADFGGRRTFLWRPEWLQNIKARFAGDAELQPALRALLANAEAGAVYPRRQAQAAGQYSNWTPAAALDLAALGECVGVDVWRFRSPDGRSLRAAVDFIAVAIRPLLSAISSQTLVGN